MGGLWGQKLRQLCRLLVIFFGVILMIFLFKLLIFTCLLLIVVSALVLFFWWDDTQIYAMNWQLYFRFLTFDVFMALRGV